MTDPAAEAQCENRLPAAYSQGFAHVRVLVATPNGPVEPDAATPAILQEAEPAAPSVPEAKPEA